MLLEVVCSRGGSWPIVAADPSADKLEPDTPRRPEYDQEPTWPHRRDRPDMARNRQQTGERVGWLHRVWWGTVRVHPEYRRDVATFLRRLRTQAGLRRAPRRFQRTVLPPTAAKDDEAWRETTAPTPFVFPLSPAEMRRQASPENTAYEGIRAYRALLKSARADHWPTLARPVAELRELARDFEAKWGLWFPIPPRVGGRLRRIVPYPDRLEVLRAAAKDAVEAVPNKYPRQFMTAKVSVPVREHESSASLLVLDVWLPAGKRVFAHISGHLDLVQEHRWPKRPLLDPATGRERMSPRKALKRAPPPATPHLRLMSPEWMRVSIANPSSANGSEIQKLLKPHLMRATFTLRTEKEHYGQMFLACRELTHCASVRQRNPDSKAEVPTDKPRTGPRRLTRAEVARALALTGDPLEQMETLAHLRRAYRHACRILGLPRIRGNPDH